MRTILGQQHILFLSQQAKNLGDPAVCMYPKGWSWREWGGGTGGMGGRLT